MSTSSKFVTTRYLTVEELSARLHLGPQALYSARHRGVEPASLGVKVGRRILWLESDIDQWFRDQQDRNG